MKSILFWGLFLTSSSLWASSHHHLLIKKIVETNTKRIVKTLAHPSGLSLYTFVPDSESSSVCNGTCAEKWPPYILTDKEVEALSSQEGDNKQKLGVIERDNGLKQLTINKRPVYLFYKDRRFQDALGDGLGNVWHIVEDK